MVSERSRRTTPHRRYARTPFGKPEQNPDSAKLTLNPSKTEQSPNKSKPNSHKVPAAVRRCEWEPPSCFYRRIRLQLCVFMSKQTIGLKQTFAWQYRSVCAHAAVCLSIVCRCSTASTQELHTGRFASILTEEARPLHPWSFRIQRFRERAKTGCRL